MIPQNDGQGLFNPPCQQLFSAQAKTPIKSILLECIEKTYQHEGYQLLNAIACVMQDNQQIIKNMSMQDLYNIADYIVIGDDKIVIKDGKSINDSVEKQIVRKQIQELEFPIRIILDEKDSNDWWNVKRAFVGGLMFPPELQDKQAHFNYIHKYRKVPIQQLISAQLGHIHATNALIQIITFGYLQQCHTNEPFVQLVYEYMEQKKKKKSQHSNMCIENSPHQKQETIQIYIKRTKKPPMYTKTANFPCTISQVDKFIRVMWKYYEEGCSLLQFHKLK